MRVPSASSLICPDGFTRGIGTGCAPSIRPFRLFSTRKRTICSLKERRFAGSPVMLRARWSAVLRLSMTGSPPIWSSNRRVVAASSRRSMTRSWPICCSMQPVCGLPVGEWRRWTGRLTSDRVIRGGACW